MGSCTLTAHVAASATFLAASGVPQDVRGEPVSASYRPSEHPASPVFGGRLHGLGHHERRRDEVGHVDRHRCAPWGNLTVSFVGAGSCTLTAHVAAGVNYAGRGRQVHRGQARRGPTTAPSRGQRIYVGGLPRREWLTNGDGAKSVTSNSPASARSRGLAVSYVGVGTCSLTRRSGRVPNYLAGSGSAQSIAVGARQPTTPIITNLPLARLSSPGSPPISARTATARPRCPRVRQASAKSSPMGRPSCSSRQAPARSRPASARERTIWLRPAARRRSRSARPRGATGWSAPTVASSRLELPPSTGPWADGAAAPGGRHHADPHPRRILARRFGRRPVQLR